MTQWRHAHGTIKKGLHILGKQGSRDLHRSSKSLQAMAAFSAASRRLLHGHSVACMPIPKVATLTAEEHQSKSESWSLSDLLEWLAFLKFRGGAAGLLLYPESAACKTCTAANLSASICGMDANFSLLANMAMAIVRSLPLPYELVGTSCHKHYFMHSVACITRMLSQGAYDLWSDLRTSSWIEDHLSSEVVFAAQIIEAHHIIDCLLLADERQCWQHPDLQLLHKVWALLSIDLH